MQSTNELHATEKLDDLITNIFGNPALSRNHFLDTLRHILVPRVVGTPQHTKVKEYLKEQLKSLGWSVTSDIFVDQSPIFGPLSFENIIAKLNPGASQVIVFSCHYDSKFFPKFEFVGATDAAVPCAMLVHLAHSLQRKLEPLKKADTSVEIWFFDGEEAFEEWGPTDSLYGARHLAAKLAMENLLSRIRCLILLDLLGTKNPNIFNYYDEKDVFQHLVCAEIALKNNGVLRGLKAQGTYFKDKQTAHFVEDDHTPFRERGVPVVHIIPSKFPDVWHTPADNVSAIDMNTVEDIMKILCMFILTYFNI